MIVSWVTGREIIEDKTVRVATYWDKTKIFYKWYLYMSSILSFFSDRLTNYKNITVTADELANDPKA